MKKIILILFLFCSLYICYYIYKITDDHNIDIVLIGDNVADNPYLNGINNIGVINNDFVNKEYRIVDVIDIIKYNKEIDIDDKTESLHLLLMNADILIISIGMNDLYYKLNDDTKEIYTYMNKMISDYQELLNEVKRYEYKKVYVLGYYNINNKKNDIFSYINYKLKNLCNKYGYDYLDLNKILYNNDNFYVKKDNFYLNRNGYKKIYELIVENLKKN